MRDNDKYSFLLSSDRTSIHNPSPPKAGSTETIDLGALFAAELDEKGSFDLATVSQSTFAQLLQAIPVPTLLVARTHVISFANDAFMTTIRDSLDLEGATFSSLFPNPGEAREAQLLLEKVFEERKPEVMERVLQVRDVKIWARIHLRTIRLGNEALVLVQIENLTAHKQLLSIQKYKKLVKILPIGIAEFALPRLLECSLPFDRLLSAVLDARVVDGNAKFASIYRRQNISELKGTRLAMLLPCTGKLETLYRQWIQARFPIRSFDSRETDSPGSVRFFENTLIGNINNECLAGFWWLKLDVSEKKKAEEEIAKSKKIESLGILAGGIAHDFNNLLTGILGNISLAQTYLTPDHRAFRRLEAAADASQRARELTHQLLTFSKGGLPIKTTASVSELLTDSAGFVLRGSNVRYELAIPQDLWSVDIDLGQIHQVVNNLFINALQAMPKGGTISVQAENCIIERDSVIPLIPGKYVRIHIQDQGVGIAPENVPKIFDPYFTTKETGSGLGLTTAYSIVKKHDGLITVGSQVGIGTTFCIYLPASRASAGIPLENKTKNSTHGRKGKILVMDDEDLIRDLVAELLIQLGYEVSSVKDGASAINAYQQAKNSGEPFDAIIMDLTIPGGIGGQEALQRIREIDPNVRAIVSSGYSHDPVMANYKGYGFVGVLLKPYDTDDIAAKLKSVLTGVTDSDKASD
jgi:two-component system, cell cycle sensor histidine kinase and response regulator CckA